MAGTSGSSSGIARAVRSPRTNARTARSSPQEQAGLASGIVNTTYQVGSALGLAALTALAPQGADLPALTDGFSAAFLGTAAVAAAGCLLTAAFMRGTSAGASADPEPVTEPSASARLTVAVGRRRRGLTAN
ncbi:hypothetical protein GCM10027075_22860 [Streptomyces heilongjiangensis]